MDDKRNQPPAPPSEERRQQFAPHHDPKKQPDGDPGPKSAREGAVEKGGTDAPEPVEDQTTDD
jgi:hypothetical protein